MGIKDQFQKRLAAYLKNKRPKIWFFICILRCSTVGVGVSHLKKKYFIFLMMIGLDLVGRMEIKLLTNGEIQF